MTIVLLILFVVGIANLITKQTIGRQLVRSIFCGVRYDDGVLGFIQGILTCSPCASVWIGIIIGPMLLGTSDILLLLEVPLISMWISYLSER